MRPYPLYLTGGQGARISDVDGNSYIDSTNNWTSLIHGHAHPATVRAATEQIARGTAWSAANPHAQHLAEIIVERVPSVDFVRFCNSGTEATMMAVRAARAYTGRTTIIKMLGAYHGSYDDFLVANGHAAPGIDPTTPGKVVEVPFNDKAAATAALHEHGAETAAVIVEGLMGSAGMITPEDDYLLHLRQETERHGALLIFDEVISLRLALGGAQQVYAVRPDLTAMGKIIGGGFAVGAFGGRREVMELFDPRRPNPLGHSGTFNANPVTMAAGVATMQALTESELARINALGDRFAEGVRDRVAERGIRLQVTGYGSLRNLHFTPDPVRNAGDAQRADAELPGLFHMALLNRGVFGARRGMFAFNTAMTDADVDTILAAVDDTLRWLRPAIAERAPGMMG
jgi:glutamate-1-semialdehyde 2,1-aminomutase